MYLSMKSSCLIVVPCLLSPCLNNGTCVAANSARQQSICNCIGVYSGTYCETGDKVRMYTYLMYACMVD